LEGVERSEERESERESEREKELGRERERERARERENAHVYFIVINHHRRLQSDSRSDDRKASSLQPPIMTERVGKECMRLHD
jgi:hypothetical protein